MSEPTRELTGYTLTALALFREARDGKATAGSAKVCLLTDWCAQVATLTALDRVLDEPTRRYRSPTRDIADTNTRDS